MPDSPLYNAPQITYAHASNPAGCRFRQYAADPVPPWAVDIQPYSPPSAQMLYDHIATSTPEQWLSEATPQHLYLHAGSRLCIQHQLHENPAFALELQNPEAEELAFLHSFDQTILPQLSPYLIELLIDHLQKELQRTTSSSRS